MPRSVIPTHLLSAIALIMVLCGSLVALDYPYAPYNQGKMDPQMTGWPLTQAEIDYVAIDVSSRRVGSETGGAGYSAWLQYGMCTPSADSFGTPTAYTTSHAQTLSQTSGYKADKGSNVDILLLGDSITAQWSGMVGYEQYPHFFNAPWTSHFPSYSAINLGIGGDKTYGLLWRLDHGGSILNTLNPRLVILAIGHNDMFFTPQTGTNAAAQGVLWCVKNVREKFPNASVLVVKILPCKTPTDQFYIDAKAINQAIDGLNLTSDAKVRVLPDMWNDWINADGTLKAGLLGDGVHPTQDAGYTLYADKLKPTVDQILGTSSATVPTVTTTAASAITATGATSGGNVTADGGTAVTARGVCWSTTANPTTASSKSIDGTGTGSFTSAISGLGANTVYHVRAYAANTVGTAYGADLTFTTAAVSSTPTAPTVTTTAVSGITTTGASSGGNVSADGGVTVTARGVCWSPTANPTTANTKTVDGSGTGAFASSITSLSANTAYHVRAYATNSVGTSYGADQSFTSSSGAVTPGYVLYNDAVQNGWVSNGWSSTIDPASSITVHGGAKSFAVTMTTTGAGAGFFYNAGGNFNVSPYSSFTFWINGGSTGGQKLLLKGYQASASPVGYMLPALTANTWVRYSIPLSAIGISGASDLQAIRFVDQGSSQGNAFYLDDVSFDPQGTVANLPTVTTATTNAITSTGATSGGTVTADGGAAVTARGVCWSTTANPTTANTKTVDGSGTGSFTSAITGLTANTAYHVRAYATNSVGTSYGADQSFTSSSGSTTPGYILACSREFVTQIWFGKCSQCVK